MEKRRRRKTCFSHFSQWRRSDIHLIDTCSCITNAQYDIIKLLHARVVGLKSSALQGALNTRLNKCVLVFLTSLLYRHGDEKSGWQRSREAVDDAAEALLNLSVGTVSDSFEADPSALLRFSISSHNHATSVLKSIGLSFPEDVPNFAESTIGGQTTCIICFINPKSHAAVPCGHQCACSDCSAQMRDFPVCHNPAREWMQVRVA